MPEDEWLQFYLDEACYYLKKMGIGYNVISEKTELQQVEIKKRIKRHQSRIRNGEAKEDDADFSFWNDMLRESKGDVKITFSRKDGFYHCRQSDLETMDSLALMEIFDASKDFLQLDPSYNYGFLDGKSPVGFDPLALAREVKKAVTIIEKILSEREGSELPKRD